MTKENGDVLIRHSLGIGKLLIAAAIPTITVILTFKGDIVANSKGIEGNTRAIEKLEYGSVTRQEFLQLEKRLEIMDAKNDDYHKQLMEGINRLIEDND